MPRRLPALCLPTALALLPVLAATLMAARPARAAEPAHAPAKAEAKADAKATAPAKAEAKAADGHAAAKAGAKPADAHAAKPADSPAAKPAPKPAEAHADPMDTLREKLASKLGAHPAPQAKSPYVVRVVSKAGPEHASGHGAPKGHAMPSAKALAAAHRGGPGAHAGHAHWAYNGDAGPAGWASLKPEFATCGSGQRQSPIDIRGGIKVDLEPVNFDYRASSFGVVDNGHTVQVNMASGNSIEVMGRRYELLQFHFHRPSEERIDGRQFDMVAHLVHKDPEGRLAVVAVLLDRGSVHPLVQTVWNNLPLEKGEELRASPVLDLNQLLPGDRRYYTYMGSLTTPPCSEGVLWLVMAQPVGIAPEQIAVFSRLYPMNARPIQQASGRLIKQSQ